MSRYLMTCTCGEPVEVETRQAGGQVTCRCGALLDVPTLRSLRHLPTADSPVAPSQSTWSFRHGLLAFSLIVAIAAGVCAGYFWITQPEMPELDLDLRQQYVADSLEKMTPKEGWEMWTEFYEPLSRSGFETLQPPGYQFIVAQIAQGRVRLTIALVIMALGLIAALAVTLTGPRPASAEQLAKAG